MRVGIRDILIVALLFCVAVETTVLVTTHETRWSVGPVQEFACSTDYLTALLERKE